MDGTAAGGSNGREQPGVLAGDGFRVGPAGADDAGQALGRIRKLIGLLDARSEASAPERELVDLLLDLHAIGLARLMALVKARDGGVSTLAWLVKDGLVRPMLQLHGLHADDLESRVHRVVELLRPALEAKQLRLEIVEIEATSVHLRLQSSGDAASQAQLLMTLPKQIEESVLEAAPDLEAVVIEGLHVPAAVASIGRAAPPAKAAPSRGRGRPAPRRTRAGDTPR